MKKVIVSEYNIDSRDLSKDLAGVSFVMLSDYHNNNYNVRELDILNAIDKCAPDFVVMAGDIVTARPKEDNGKAYAFIKRIADKYKVYFGNGNHEYRMKIYKETYGDMYDEFLANISHSNIEHLINANSSIKIGNTDLRIYGLEIDRQYYKRFKKISMDDSYIESLVGKPLGDYNILIAHNPKYFKNYASWGAQLVLSGHVHGGLLRLPVLGGVLSPDLKLFPKYDKGMYKENKSKMILSSGLGAHTLKIRVFNPVEVVCIRFQ